jgi:hypothetical protein
MGPVAGGARWQLEIPLPAVDDLWTLLAGTDVPHGVEDLGHTIRSVSPSAAPELLLVCATSPSSRRMDGRALARLGASGPCGRR